VNRFSLLAPVVVQKGHRFHFHGRAVENLPHNLFPGETRPENDDPFSVFAVSEEPFAHDRTGVQYHPHPHPDAADEKQGQHEINEKSGSREALKLVEECNKRGHEQRRCDCRDKNLFQIHQAGIAPHPAVEPEKIKTDQLDQDDPIPGGPELGPLRRVQREFKPQQIGRKMGQQQQNRVEQQHEIQVGIFQLSHFHGAMAVDQ